MLLLNVLFRIDLPVIFTGGATCLMAAEALFVAATAAFFVVSFCEDGCTWENDNDKEEVDWNDDTSKHSKGFDTHHRTEVVGHESSKGGEGSNRHCL